MGSPSEDNIVVLRPETNENYPQNLCLDAGYTGSAEKVQKYIAIVGLECYLSVQFEKSARCNIDYDKAGTPRKETRYVSPTMIQV